ncbi:MAG: hypothetical protein DME57_02510, partial [Verrucomicrobia bacterium]
MAHNQIFPTGTAALPVHARPRSAHAANMIPRNALMATSCPPRDSASSSPYAPTLSAPAASTRLTAMRDYTGKIVLSVENEYSGKMPERQLRLFEHPRPLLTRLGADFFKSVPPCPGVYLMSNDADRLLYVGQSSNLRVRLGSYKNANPHHVSRKTLRLVHSVAR